MADGSSITGGCLCGAVRWEASAPPISVSACWCRLCQYLAAGSATVNLIFARDAVSITGDLVERSSIADSGNHMTRSFCPRCGTPIASASAERGDRLVLRAGTLDDAGAFAPQSLIWTAQAPPWAAIDADLPCFAGQPPPVA